MKDHEILLNKIKIHMKTIQNLPVLKSEKEKIHIKQCIRNFLGTPYKTALKLLILSQHHTIKY